MNVKIDDVVKGFLVVGIEMRGSNIWYKLICISCGQQGWYSHSALRGACNCKFCTTKREDNRLYLTWKSMKNRCNNINNRSYNFYGGRGIKVCARWLDFDLFLEDMEGSFKEGLTLDRIDVNGDYCKENCRWATTEEQSNNKRNSLSLEFEGKIYTEAQLARYTGVSRTTIQARRNKGFSVEEMVYGRKRV